MSKLELFETTLRDGLQARGTKTTLEGQLAIAQSLLDVGFDTIEAGTPASGADEFMRIQEIVRMAKGHRSKIAAFAKSDERTIGKAADALVEAGPDKGVISVLVSLGRDQIATRFNSNSEAINEYIRQIRIAARTGFPIHTYLENATRADPEVLSEIVPPLAEESKTISVPDTSGVVRRPVRYGKLIQRVKELANGKPVSTHTHDDLHLANANALAAIEHGATSVEGTILGIGERIGNLPWEQFLYTLLAEDEDDAYPFELNIDPSKIGAAINVVREQTGLIIPRKQPLIGADAYRTKAGIHQAGLRKNLNTYLGIHPEFLGIPGPEDVIVFGEGSGRSGVEEALEKHGIDIEADRNTLRQIAEEAMDLARTTDDAELPMDVVAAYAMKTVGDGGRYKPGDVFEYNASGDDESLEFTLTDSQTGKVITINENGEGGLIALACRGMQKATGIELTIGDGDWHSQNVGSGANTPEFIRVRMKNGDRFYEGLGLDRDSNKAGILAVLRAYNKAVAAHSTVK